MTKNKKDAKTKTPAETGKTETKTESNVTDISSKRKGKVKPPSPPPVEDTPPEAAQPSDASETARAEKPELTYEPDGESSPAEDIPVVVPEGTTEDERLGLADQLEGNPTADANEKSWENLEETPPHHTEVFGDDKSLEEMPATPGAEIQKADADAWDALDDGAERFANAASNDLISDDKSLQSVKMGMAKTSDRKTLTTREKERLNYYEGKIAAGLRSYVSVGKWLFAIWSEDLHLGNFDSWQKYTSEKWGITGTGSYDLMNAYRTWRMASSRAGMTFADAVSPERWLKAAPENESPQGAATDDESDIIDGEAVFDDKPAKKQPASDADAPSQRSIEELAKLRAFLERNGLDDEQFANFETAATQAVYEMATAFDPEGKFTQKTVNIFIEAFVEFAQTKAFEIDGEHYPSEAVKMADFRITQGLFESLMSDKQRIREFYQERNKRMSEPQTRKNSEYVAEKSDDRPEIPSLIASCSCGQDGADHVHQFMFGAVQMGCGHVFGMPRDETEVKFNPKLTKDNPIKRD